MGGSLSFSTLQLPAGLEEAIRILQAEWGPGARVDAVADNFVYLWLPDVRFDESKYPVPHQRGLWVRIPVQFPHANPHGIVTPDPMVPLDGHAVKGHNPGHEMCNPVATSGGKHYYSWTWSGEIGPGPLLTSPRDILLVVPWVERRIKNA